MNKPGLYLCIYADKEYLVNVQGINPCLRIISILDLTKFKNGTGLNGSKSLIKEIEDNLDKCTFKYVSFSTEIILEKEVPIESDVDVSSYKIEKYRQYYLNNGLSESKLQVFILKDMATTSSIARSIARDVKLQVKRG